jgi:hypothetical protein
VNSFGARGKPRTGRADIESGILLRSRLVHQHRCVELLALVTACGDDYTSGTLGDVELLPHAVGVVVLQVAEQLVVTDRKGHGDPADTARSDAVAGPSPAWG